MQQICQSNEVDLNGWCMPYVLQLNAVWQRHRACSFNFMPLFIARLNVSILLGLIRAEPRLGRRRAIVSAAVDIPLVRDRFGCIFCEIANGVFRVVRSKLGCLRWLSSSSIRIVRRFETFAIMISFTGAAFRGPALTSLAILVTRIRVLLRRFRSRLRTSFRLSLLRRLIVRLGCGFQCKELRYHIESPNLSAH